MATYNKLSIGSSGEEVRKLQNALMSAGYDVGSSGADGKFGPSTSAAVKKYQKDMGLSVDGVAGKNTQGALYGNSGNTTGKSTVPSSTGTVRPTTRTTTSKTPTLTYDAAGDQAYQEALKALLEAQKNAPTYANSYEDQLKDLYDRIVNRDKFRYDINQDELYQQYAKQYAEKGRMAMMDTMGQAAALTGGYASTYGQAVGQQQYDAYLQQLNDVVPELYQMAYQQYQDEGDRMQQQYGMLGDLADDEYSKYRDAYNQWLTERDYAQGNADTAYDRGYTSGSSSGTSSTRTEITSWRRRMPTGSINCSWSSSGGSRSRRHRRRRLRRQRAAAAGVPAARVAERAAIPLREAITSAS